MKKIFLILIAAVVSLACSAKDSDNKDKIDGKDIEKIYNDLNDKIISPLNEQNDKLNKEITTLNDQINKLRDRNKRYHSPFSNDKGQNLDEYLGSFGTLNDMFFANDNEEKSVVAEIEKAMDSERKEAYLLAFEMKESLSKPYDEKSNSDYITAAKDHRKDILKSHSKEYNELVNLINDYNDNMFVLAQLFVAADKDGYKKSAEQLATDEHASNLLEVPYIMDVLQEYITSHGLENFSDELKKELYDSCPDAFSDFS